MGEESLRAGVVGCGFIAQNAHIPSIHRCKNVSLAAICDRNGDLVRSVARKFKIAKYYTDFQEMLDLERLDVVNVCTSIDTHASLAIQAMEAGCHVFTEKPLALNTKDADRMIEVSRKNNVKLGTNHHLLFIPPVQKIRRILDKGTIGNLVRVEIKQSCPPEDFPIVADPNHWWHRLPGGVFGDTLPHPIYLAREFLGEIEAVAVYPKKMGNLEHMRFDEVQIVLEGREGVGTIISSCNWPSLWLIDIFGTKRNIHANLHNSVVITYGGKTDMGKGIAFLYARENLQWSFRILADTFAGGVNFVRGKHRGIPASIQKFMESIRDDTEPPVSGEDGREVLRVWEKITGQMLP
jgi:UDP-N-acetylglucosamine 3-dehydrogenase